jgi:hypothetical protein
LGAPSAFRYDCADHRFWRRAENHALRIPADDLFSTIYYFANRLERAAVGSERVLKKDKKRSYSRICFGGGDHESHYAHPRLAGARIGHWDCNGHFYTDATGCSVRWSELLISRSATAASPQESTRAERKTRVLTEATGDSIAGGRGRELDAALDRLMIQPERPTHGEKRRVFPMGQQYPRPLDPACRFRSPIVPDFATYPNLRATIQSAAATTP